VRRAATVAAAAAFFPLAFVYWFVARLAAQLAAIEIVGECYAADDLSLCLRQTERIEVIALAIAATLYAGLLCWAVRRLRRPTPAAPPE
jgi:hypothetical protein